ncbi:MAG: lipopolysaccharide biosynthesis protein [Candidatus Dojkabacteria bacterium]|jgi:O-antigen/teichoic acid export membrane protein
MAKLLGKERKFIINLFLTTVLGGIVGLLNYAFNILVAKYTSPVIFGTFSAALGIIYLSQIAGTSVQSLVTKTVAQNKDKDLNTYKWSTLISFSILGVVVAGIFFLLRYPIAEIASLPVEYMLYLAIALIFSFISPVSKGLLLGEEKVITVNFILLGETLLRFLVGIIAINRGGDIPLLILSNTLPTIASTILIIPLLQYKTVKKKIAGQNWKEFFLMSISFLLLTMPFTLDLILVNEAFRAEYSSLSLLGKIVYFACVITSSVMFARLTNEEKAQRKRRSLLIALALSLAIGIVLSAIFFLFGDFVVKFSVGEQYLSIVKYLGVFGLCMTGYSIVYMIANYFISNNTYSYILILFCATVLQIILFTLRNSSIDIVVKNQIVLYSLLTLSTILFLVIKFIKDISDEKKEKNNKRKN